jgi:hypothetical protein
MERQIASIEKYNINLYDENENEQKNQSIQIENVYWFPNPIILKHLTSSCLERHLENILEIGPGVSPFPLAKKFIGYNEKVENYINIDLDKEKIPFKNKELDFTYCRHVLEDIQKPDDALYEIIRVSKNFYIETPSPLVEITKGVDARSFSNLYTGYIHHRFIIWSDFENETVYILPKYGFIENALFLTDSLRKKINYILNNYPVYWNTYFKNKSENTKIVFYNHFNDDEYCAILYNAILTSIKSTNNFVKSLTG